MTASSAPTPLPAVAPGTPASRDRRSSPHNQHNAPESRPKEPIPATPKPKLRLQIADLRHPSSSLFLTSIPDPLNTLETALRAIIANLYTIAPQDQKNSPPIPIHFEPSIPPTRSVTVILRDFPGVAYTTGSELDDDHKEINVSLSYIQTSSQNHPNGVATEIKGVLTHELVHCYQHTAPPSDAGGDVVPGAPMGLIEGIADFVRLKAGLAPPHWKRPTSAKERAPKWDQGYQFTAYFLEWIEDVRVGRGAVGMLNDRLLRVGYIGEQEGSSNYKLPSFWVGLFGIGIQELWDEYGRYLDIFGGTKREPRSSGSWEEEIVNPPD